MKVSHKVALPIAVLVLGCLGSVGLVTARPSVAKLKPEIRTPIVEVLRAEPQDTQFTVRAQGSVQPEKKSDLVSEISARIVWVSPRLASGSFVDEGEVLIRLDASDYETAAERAEAAVTRAESERGWAGTKQRTLERLVGSGVASNAALDEAANRGRVAAAAERDARATLRQARNDLARTEIRAPFAARVQEKRVDIGQFVSRGSVLARLFGVDYALVRLPISEVDAAFVELPFYNSEAGSDADPPGPAVTLTAHFAGRDYRWRGVIVRTEAEIDAQTRMIHAVARVEDPYDLGQRRGRPPLAVGLFVEAEIAGRHFPGAIAVPRSALRGESELMLVDGEGKLRFRHVEVLRRDRDQVWLRSGVASGDLVCTTPLRIAVNGMPVRVSERPAKDGRAS